MSEKKAITEPEMPLEIQIVTRLIKLSEYNGIFDSGFNLADFAQKAELRGMKGEPYWSDQMLEAVMERFRQHYRSHDMKPEDADSQLALLSSKIGVDLNRLRRAFYGYPDLSHQKTTETPMNPDPTTIMAIIGINQAAWKALPEDKKQQIHDAIVKGQLGLAKSLVGAVTGAAKAVTG
jgi:hypothetical protein